VPAVEGTITQPLSTNESQPKEQGDKGAVQQGVDAMGQGNAEREVTVLESAEVNTIPNVAKDFVGEEVEVDGRIGLVKVDEGGKYTIENDKEILEITPDTKIKPIYKDVVKVENNNVEINNDKFELLSINKDNNGNVVSVTLKNEKGRVITKLDTNLAIDIAVKKNNQEFDKSQENKENKPTISKEQAQQSNTENTEAETKAQIENFGVPKEDVEATHGVISQIFGGLKKAGLTAAKTVGDWVGIGKGEVNPNSLKEDDNGKLYSRKHIGGNSGYVGYSMSNRAAQAYDDGKLTYSKLPTWAKRMVDAGMAKTDEWHHTSSYGNETPFYEVKQFFDHLTDAEKEKLGVDDFESFKDVPKDVIKEIDVKSKEALKKKNNIKEVRKGYVDAAQKELNDFNAKFKSFSRVSKSPEHGIVSSYEMNGKYGWFEATSRYNLPEYQSGIDYETAANRQKAVELESKLSTAKNEPIYKIELQKRGFDENEINELKKSGIIHSEIMPESFYANAERNKDIIKKQVKELSELPKPVAEFNPRFGKSTENFLTDAEKQARQNRHYSISEQGENFGSSYERRLAHEDNDNEYSRIAGERYDKAKQEFLNSDEVQKQEEKFNEDKAKAADITGNLKHLFGIEDGQPLFKDAEAQYRIESGKNIIEAIKDFTKAENKAEATVALTHEIIHPTVAAIIDGAKEGNEVGMKHTKTIVDEFNKANPKDKVTVDELISGNDDFKEGTTSKKYRAVQEFIAESWEQYHTEGGKGFSEAFQKFLDQITKAFQSVYKSITGKNLTPELNKMFDEILGKEQAKSIQETIDKKENVSLINKIKNYAAEVIANREKISRLSEQAEQGRKEGGIRNVEATLLLTTGGEKSGQVKGREAQQQIIEKYAKEEGIWHDNIDVEPKRGQTQEGIGIFKDSGVENQVYIPTENPHIVRKAMKTTDPFNKDNPNEVLYHLDSRISEHNAGLGSSVPYKVVGFGRMSDGSFVVITEQPHIQDARLATKAEIKKEMLNRGYEQDGKDSFGDENHFITDVNPKNVLVDKNGNLHFIDTIYDILYDVNEGDRAQMPKFNATTEAKGVTPEQTERANRILDFLKLTVAYFKGGKNIITDAKEYARAVLEIFEANNLEDIRHSFISNKNANLFSGSFNGKTLADNFNKAVEMDGNGEPSERIKFATGWYKAGDGKWRYEVTDKNAKLKVSLPNKGETIATKLEDILDHPRLFEIYPQLKNTDVIITNNNINSDYGGFFISEHGSNSTPTIHVNTRGEINATVSELIHEVQHNVQAISGLTPGNNNEAILGRLKDEFRSEHGRNPNTNEERKLFIEANREYLGTYGEIEARASQHNIHITENERLFNSTIAGTIKRFEIKPEDVSFPKQKIEINKVGNVINFLSTSQGEVYGFVSEGKMYLDPAKLTSELVTEEFTHIQQQALRLAAKQGDKKAQKIVSAWDNATNRVADEFIKGVRGNNMSEYVRDLLNLLGITKAEMASEVYQKQPNESAAAYKTRLQDELWAKAQKPEFAKHLEKLASENKLTAITRRIYEALKDFYRYVINRFTNEDLSKLSLLELIKRTNRELTKGNWLSVLEKGKSIVEAGNNMQAQAQQGQPLFMAVVGEKANLKQTVRDNLYTARQMEASKVDSNTIYLATGWERGNDGKWNYEIPDMQFKDNELIEKEITLVLENKKDHYEAQLSQIEGDNPLTERYPQLRGTILQFVYEPGVSFKGEYDANVQKVDGRMGTVISINTARLDEAVKQYGLDKEGGGVYSQRRLAAHSILIHELQHAIQDIEGFANGGNGAIARKIIFEKVENEIKNLAAYKTLLNKEQELQSQGKMLGDPEFEKLQDDIASFKIKYAAQMTKSGTLKESEYETYKSLTGEVQARNVQGRLKMTEAQRRQTAISETEDVSRKDQIIYFSNEGTVQKVNDMMEPNSEIQLQAQAKSTVTLERVKKAFNRLVNKTELVKNPKKEILRVSGLMVDLGFPEKQINAVAQTIGADAANLPEAERKIISEKAKKEFEEEKTSSFLEVLDTLSARNVEGNPDAIIDAADWKNTASNIGVDNKRLSSPDNPDTLVKDDRELTILMSGETLKKAGIVFIDDNSLDAENDQLRVKFKLDQKANELENIYFTLGICKT